MKIMVNRVQIEFYNRLKLYLNLNQIVYLMLIFFNNSNISEKVGLDLAS